MEACFRHTTQVHFVYQNRQPFFLTSLDSTSGLRLGSGGGLSPSRTLLLFGRGGASGGTFRSISFAGVVLVGDIFVSNAAFGLASAFSAAPSAFSSGGKSMPIVVLSLIEACLKVSLNLICTTLMNIDVSAKPKTKYSMLHIMNIGCFGTISPKPMVDIEMKTK